jgi:hypothetical protein
LEFSVFVILKAVSRTPLQTVTLPLLVPSSKAAGSCAPSLLELVNVRVVAAEEAWVERRAVFCAEDCVLFDALAQLRRAYEGRDSAELLVAAGVLRQFLPTLPGWTVTEDWTGSKIWDGARWRYAELLTAAMGKARLVMWWPTRGKGLLAPAIYCPDMKTAVFCALSQGAIRVCPKCRAPFVPDKTSVVYCTPSHGVAFRTARSRWNKGRAKKEGIGKKAVL